MRYFLIALVFFIWLGFLTYGFSCQYPQWSLTEAFGAAIVPGLIFGSLGAALISDR